MFALSIQRVSLALLAFALTSGAAAAAPRSPLALSCLGCHQPGVNAATMPALNEMPPQAIRDALISLRDQPQPGLVMSRFVGKLTDADIQQLAEELGKPDKRDTTR